MQDIFLLTFFVEKPTIRESNEGAKMKTREIIISVDQLELLKEILDNVSNGKHMIFSKNGKEEIDLLSGIFEDIINSEEDVVHGVCY